MEVGSGRQKGKDGYRRRAVKERTDIQKNGGGKRETKKWKGDMH